MDYITMGGITVPYPNDFTMAKEPNIVGEITTLSGRTIADINGWKWADATLKWDTLREAELLAVLGATDPMDGTFVLAMEQPEGSLSVNAMRTGRTVTKTRLKDEQGNLVWSDVQMTLAFPDCYHS